MVQLSVIIVNYNVKFFLQQAIRYAQRAANFYHKETGKTIEIIVVDNNSSDDSVLTSQQLFPEITFIANTKNVGFSAANNQGIKISKGKYIVLLNPDTIVQEDTFLKCINFMDKNPEIGGLGVKMIDGRGTFLPESKRGLPSPKVALFKMLGLSTLFYKSPYFNQYHLGFLSKNENHEIEILSGAYMFMRKEALDKVGLLDETFFMYGEDIDLSYRIIKGGYKNYYLADTRIVHYKGESTKKGSLNYVRIFYNAMIIFARKHFSKQGAGFMILPIKIGIYIRALIAILSRFFKQSALFIFDAAAIVGGMFWLKNLYATQVKNNPDFFETELMTINIPIYTFLWLLSTFFSGGYDLPYRSGKLGQGLLIGTLLISAVYGFLDESLRSSRALIVLGAIWAFFALSIIRKVANFFRTGSSEANNNENKRVILVGEMPQIQDAYNFVKQVNPQAHILGMLSEKESPLKLAKPKELNHYVSIFEAEEIIFCEENVPAFSILESMETLGAKKEYKIYNSTGDCLIGSNSKNTAGDFYAHNTNLNLAKNYHRRNKRVFDILFALLILLSFPFLLFSKGGKTIFNNIFPVLIGKKTWISYFENSNKKLPKLKNGVFTCLKKNIDLSLNEKTKAKLNLLYAKDYSVWKDFIIILQKIL